MEPIIDYGQFSHQASRQLIEQHLGVLQYRRVEAFNEPAVNGGEKAKGLTALSLIAP
jgi:hypothetical protein